MDWRAIKFDWNRARAFLVTAEEGSLSAAARALGMAQPTVGRQVSALEQELGVVLFERVGRGLTPTPGALELLDHVRSMGEAAGRVSLAASGRAQTIDGTICITASEVVCAYLLSPIIARLRTEYPGIHVDLVASNQARDLRRREADIAVRNFRPTDPDLVTKKVKEVGGRLYAAVEYLERIGRPREMQALSRADFIGFDRGDALIDGLNAMGMSLTQANFVLVTDNQLVQWELVKQGVGIGMMTDDIGDLEPRVERALPPMAAIPVPMWLTTHREVHTSRRVRVVFDLLAEALAG